MAGQAQGRIYTGGDDGRSTDSRLRQRRAAQALSKAGNDTKFFERNRALLIALLDIRFEGEAGRMGLESFLGAMPEGEQWLLLADLDGSLLPFE